MSKFAELLEDFRKERRIRKKELAHRSGLSSGYISLLTLGERESPSEETVAALAQALMLDKEASNRLFEAAGYTYQTANIENTNLYQVGYETKLEKLKTLHGFQGTHVNWGDAPDTGSFFHGRAEELQELEQWIIRERCRVVALLGIGGIGKTTIAAKLAKNIKDQFDFVLWLSLRDSPPLSITLERAVRFIIGPQSTSIPDAEVNLQLFLLQQLNAHRCLIIMDNAESILQAGERFGHYRDGFEDYGDLIRRIGEAGHQSCLLLTSREKPKEISLLEGKTSPVRTYELVGLPPQDGWALLKDKGITATVDDQRNLIEQYSGNPLALKIVAETIRELFYGDVSEFLQILRKGEAIFGDIRDLLDEQFNRLATLEQEIMIWLSIEREAVNTENLIDKFNYPVLQRDLLEALAHLRRRSLVQEHKRRFTLQSVVMEYIADFLINQIVEEVKVAKPKFLISHALDVVNAKEFVRESQIQTLIIPIVHRLLAFYKNENKVEQQLIDLLDSMRNKTFLETGYAGKNILHLLSHLHNKHLKGFDFSNLVIRDAYLRDIALHDVNFSNSDLIGSVFMANFGSILAIAVNRDGRLIAAGGVDGKIRIWDTENGNQICTLSGHSAWVRALTFSPVDANRLASFGADQLVKIWDLNEERIVTKFGGHTDQGRSIAYSPNGSLIASSSSGDNQTITLWDIETGKPLQHLRGHEDWVLSVAFSPNGRFLASSGHDQIVRIWDVNSGETIKILKGHNNWIRSIAFSPTNSRILASGDDDKTIRLWNVETGDCLNILQDHHSQIRAIAFSPNGKVLVSTGKDKTVRLWNVDSGRPLKVLHGHTNWVNSVAFNPRNETMLFTGGDDHSIRIWNVTTGELLRVLKGYTNYVWSIAFSPDGQVLASGHEDSTVRLWDVKTGKLLQALDGHDDWVMSVTFNPTGDFLTTGSKDQSIKLWDVQKGICIQKFRGHNDWVRSVTFSPDGNLLVSSGEDDRILLWDVHSGKQLDVLQGEAGWVRSIDFSPNGHLIACDAGNAVNLWDIKSRQITKILKGHENGIWQVVFSPDSRILASGSEDKSVRLWDVESGNCLQILKGHTNRVWALGFNSQGEILITGSVDQTIRVWDVRSGKCLRTLKMHTAPVRAIDFAPKGDIFASGSYDGTIILGNARTGDCLRVLKSERPYEGMEISGALGFSEMQKRVLKDLGAVENHQ